MLVSTAYAQDIVGSSGAAGIVMQLAPMLLIFVVFYFLLIRPQQRKAKEHRNMLQSLIVAALVFIIINFILTWVATRLSRRLSSRTSGDPHCGQRAASWVQLVAVSTHTTRRAVFTASATSRLAPRAEEQEPLRSRCATITGAAPAVTVASSAFKPRMWL